MLARCIHNFLGIVIAHGNDDLLVKRVFSSHVNPRLSVVATTRRNGTRSLLTSAKLSNGLSSSGDLQENSTRSPRCIAPLFI